jgi:hypothetical protein
MNTTITDLLPVNSNIHGTPFEDLINNTIGYFLELIEEEVDAMNDGCFIDTAEGRYLDLWGKDYGIPRLNDETDENYRKRLKILPLERFNIQTLYEVYDLQLLTRNDTSFNDLKLYSDNHFLDDEYWIGVSDEEWIEISRKFITTNKIRRITGNG